MEQRVKVGATISYGFILFAFGLLYSMNMVFWAYFMTDIQKFPTVLMAKTISIASIVDIFAVVIVSVLLQKLYPRIKYGTWLLIGPIVVAICFALMFFPATGLSVTAKAFLYGGAYILQCWFQNIAFGAVNTMVPLMGKHPADRAAFSARKAIGTNTGRLLFGVITLPIILAINGGVKASPNGFFIVVILYGLVFVFANYTMYRYSRQADAELAANYVKDNRKPEPLSEMFRVFFTNRHLIGIIIGDIARILAQFITMGLVAYYFMNITKSMPMFAVFLTTVSVCGIVGSIVGEILGRKFDKRYVYAGGLGLFCLVYLINFFMMTQSAMTFIVIFDIGFFGMAIANSVSIALTSEATLYSELKNNKEVKGFLMTMAIIVPKVSQFISASVIGFGLAGIGYAAGKPMTPDQIVGFNQIFNLVPAAFLALGIIALLTLNKLSTAKVNEIQEMIKAKQQSAK